MKAQGKANENQTGRVNVRFEPALKIVIDQLTKERGASDLSDYIRGLVIADAIAADKKMHGITIPGWLIGQRISIVGPREKGKEK
jgi:hypothetical protein